MSDQSIKVLIADDEESARDSIKFHLENLGYDVIAADAPTLCSVCSHGKCTVQTRCADVMLIDQNLPGITGSEFIEMQAERGCKLSPDCKMVMTGAITDEIKAFADQLGCMVLVKPLSLTEAENFVVLAKLKQTRINLI